MRQTRIMKGGAVWALVATAIAVAPAPAAADATPAGGHGGWNQYRGQARDGVAAGAPAVSWPEGGPRVVFRRSLGAGFSEMVVADGALYTGISDGVNEYVVRLDTATGDEVWRQPIGKIFRSRFGDGPRATPVVIGDLLYMVGARGFLHAIRTGAGDVVWSVDLKQRFGGNVARFGYSSSPLVEGDLLLLPAGGEAGSSVVALDATSGETRWSALDGLVEYSSSVPARLGGTRQVVLPRATEVTSLSLTGEVLWSFQMEEEVIAVPLVIGNDRVFVSASGDTGCAMLRVKKDKDGLGAEVVWKNRSMRSHFNSPVLHGRHIYGFDNATLKCISVKTGEVLWGKRGFGQGSLVVVGNRLLVLSDQGALMLVEATPEGYRELGAVQAVDGKSWTAPSFAAGRVFLRNLTEMTCLELGP